MGHLRFLVIDNIYPDPWAVRRFALAMPFADAKSDSDKKYYKGLLTSTDHPYSPYGASLIQGTLGAPIRTRFPIGEFRLLLKRDGAEEVERTWVHFDSSAANYSAIIYLNSPEQCEGGTSFYRHRESGLYHLPDPGSDLAGAATEQLGVTYPQLIDRLSEDGFSVEEEWELDLQVPMAFNRCLVFDSRLFHARTGTFGTDNASGRLTQNFFFDL